MYKSAYIIMIDGVDEAAYRRIYKTEESTVMIAGVDNENSSHRLVMELVRDGYKRISLGYGFSVYDVEQICESEEFCSIAADDVKIRCAVYNINEYAKLRNTGRTCSHGVIMAVPGVDRAVEVFISHKLHDVRAVFVKNISQAKHAARYLAKHNVGFIELCIWFDVLRMEDVIEAIDGTVPVGTCGSFDLTDLEPEIDPEKLKPKKRVYKKRR